MTSVRPVGGDAPGGAGTRSAGGRNAGEQDREVVWEFEIEPDSDGDVTVSLGAGRPCGEPGAICTADGRSLSEWISTTVEGPDTGPTGLTAAFEGLPVAHDGEGGIRFRVAFSEDIGISYRSLREDAFTVTGGRVTPVRRRCRRHPAQCGGRLRAAGGPLLRGDAAGRRQHLRIRARLPAGLWPDGGAERRHARRAGRRRPPPRESEAGRRGHGGSRPGRAGLVRRGAGSRRV